MKKILICPDKFKGSLSSREICGIALDALDPVYYEIETLPLADGGEGSLEVILESRNDIKKVFIDSFDALGRPISSWYLTDGITAWIELAKTSGLSLIAKEDRQIMQSNTFGTGLVLKHAMEKKHKQIYLFAGGSATTDGGLGIVHALGGQFLDKDQNEIAVLPLNFKDIRTINVPNPLCINEVKLILACDVKNVLLGPQGTAMVYAEQKGASVIERENLESGLQHVHQLICSMTGQAVSHLPGSGAAGGLALGLVPLLGFSLESGMALISKLTQLEQKIQSCDTVITGEGKFDQTSFSGKITGEVIKLCRKYNKPCYLICGSSLLPHLDDVEIIRLSDFESNETETTTNAAEFMFKVFKRLNEELLGTK